MLRCLAGRPLAVFGDGEQTREFTYVSDTAAGILAAVTTPGVAGETINLGTGSEITDIQAAVGRVQLPRLPELVVRRRAVAERYRQLLAGIPGLGLPEEPEWARTNWQSYGVRLPAGRDQRQVMQSMLDVGGATRRGVICAHREKPYAARKARSPAELRARQRRDHPAAALRPDEPRGPGTRPRGAAARLSLTCHPRVTSS